MSVSNVIYKYAFCITSSIALTLAVYTYVQLDGSWMPGTWRDTDGTQLIYSLLLH